MFNIFPYIFSTTLNSVSNSLGVIDDIVGRIVNSDFMNNLINEMIICRKLILILRSIKGHIL